MAPARRYTIPIYGGGGFAGTVRLLGQGCQRTENTLTQYLEVGAVKCILNIGFLILGYVNNSRRVSR